MIEKACFDMHLFDGKTKEKENLNANIEQIGVFVQVSTEEWRKSSSRDKTIHGAMFFLTAKVGCDNHLQERKILVDKSIKLGVKIR
jgi:hypothetical protein